MAARFAAPPAAPCVPYGPHPDQVANLHLPAAEGGPWPVVVLVHGGFWRSRWDRTLMTALADDLARHGFAAWNVEYRRVGQEGGGWPGTLDDVAAAVDGKRRGLVDHWLHPIREVCHDHKHELEAMGDERARWDRLVELNVIRQVKNVAQDVFVQDAWARGQKLLVHGWIYIVYVVVAFLLTQKARWTIPQLLLMLVAGLVPGLIFWVERRVAQRLREDHAELSAS